MSEPLDFDLPRRARYSQGGGIYRILPLAVARPTSQAEMRQVLAEAIAKGWSVIPRGAGTAMSGDNVGQGVVVDLTQWDPARCSIDATSRTFHCAPALTLGALQAGAHSVGLRFPPNPSSQRWATLGGMLATNAAGARSFRYGSVRNWITGLTLETVDGSLRLQRGEAPDAAHPAVRRFVTQALPRITASGHSIAQRFPVVRKNSMGYALDRYVQTGDLIDLVIGAEGTLGIVTDVRGRLDAVPSSRLAMRLMVRSRRDLLPVITALTGAGASSIEFLDRTFLHLVDAQLAGSAAHLVPQAGGVLLADLEGDDDDALVEDAEAVLATLGPELLDSAYTRNAAEAEALWQLRHGASPALARMDDGRRSLQVIEDGVVPINELPRYLDALEAICLSEGVDVVLFGHAGDGHVHANLLPNLGDPEWQARVGRIYRRVSDLVIALGGSPSGEHGAGRLRNGLLQQLYGEEVVSLFQEVKAAFDPVGLFNPDVLSPLGDAPLGPLKVGSGAPALPPVAAEWLAMIEANANWGAPRW